MKRLRSCGITALIVFVAAALFGLIFGGSPDDGPARPDVVPTWTNTPEPVPPANAGAAPQPTDTPVAEIVPTATPEPPVAEPVEETPPEAIERTGPVIEIAPSASCPQGCLEPSDGCTIKGNISDNAGPGHIGIYHTTASSSYDATVVDLEEGDRWFCTGDEAIANGFRPRK